MSTRVQEKGTVALRQLLHPEKAPDPPKTKGRTSPRPDSVETSVKGEVGLRPFASYYPQAKKLPKVSAGQTVDTFNEAQVQALHRAYWSAPPTADMEALVALAKKDPALKGHDFGERQVGRLIAKMPDSFPWGWRSRALAATSHAFVDALLKAPEGTSVTRILKALDDDHGNFPVFAAMRHAAGSTWLEEPDRFPFAKALVKTKEGFVLEARGPKEALAKDGHDRFRITPELAEKVVELSKDPEIRFDWSFPQFVAFLNDKLGGGFKASTFHSLREAYPKIVPSFNQIHASTLDAVCHLIRRLYDEEGIRDAREMVRVLHDDYGFPKWPYQQLSHFRANASDPNLVPNFKADKDEASYAEAKKFLTEIQKHPDDSYLAVGARLGHNEVRVKNLMVLIHKRWPDALEKQYHGAPYTLADRRLLQAAIDDSPLNANIEDVYKILKNDYPEVLERHPLSGPLSLYGVLREQLGLESHRTLQQQRFSEVLADFARRSPHGTSLTELVELIQDEHPGSYSLSAVKKMVDHFRAEPKTFPAVAKLRDDAGKYPWERSKIRYTEALAKRVGQEISKHPQLSLRKIVNRLAADPKFRHEYPGFHAAHVAYLRSRFPKLVPFIDELAVRGQEKRVAAWGRALDKTAKQVEQAARKAPDPTGLTIASLARQLNVKPHRVAAAIQRRPELFPWYQARPTGTLDLYLATRVAHEMEMAPLSATLGDILKKLKKDPKINSKYPNINYYSFQGLRDRYPDIVPDWQRRGAILRSKLLVDALLSAKKGTSFQAVVKALDAENPGVFNDRWRDAGSVLRAWRDSPETFPFTQVLADAHGHYRLEGRGRPPEPSSESAAELAARLAKLERIDDHLPLLDKLAEGVKSKPFGDFECLAIQHLVGPKVALMETMHRLGLAPSRTTVVGIPYSASPAVADTLRDKGYDTRVPPLDLEAWYQEVKLAMEERIASAKKSGRQILVMDDGGLCAMMFQRYPELAKESHRFKIVEQTTRGITVVDGMEIKTSVISVATSWGKYVEGPMVAAQLQAKALERLEKIGVKDLEGKHVGLIGNGTIGSPLADLLRARGAIVTILDTDEKARAAAEKSHLKALDASDPQDRKRFFSKNDIIIGATGKCSITAEDLEHLRPGAILGSASSKLVEIDVGALARAQKTKGPPEVIDKDSFPPTVRYTLKDGRQISVLASGYPLNFDGDVISIEPQKIQLTMGLLLIGALQAIHAKAAGVHPLDPEKQLQVLRDFEEVGGVKHSGAQVAAAKSLAELKLNEMKLKHGSGADRRHGA